jgi:hypothetical protein
MSNNSKAAHVMAMFSGFPSMASKPRADMEMSVASFLQVLSGFDAEIVGAACMAFRKRGVQFPPSSGELFEECELRQRAARRKAEWDNAGRPKVGQSYLSPPQAHGYTPAELVDENVIVNHVGQPYIMRPGHDYGYMTRAEMAAHRRSVRSHSTPAPSHWQDAAE